MRGSIRQVGGSVISAGFADIEWVFMCWGPRNLIILTTAIKVLVSVLWGWTLSSWTWIRLQDCYISCIRWCRMKNELLDFTCLTSGIGWPRSLLSCTLGSYVENNDVSPPPLWTDPGLVSKSEKWFCQLLRFRRKVVWAQFWSNFNFSLVVVLLIENYNSRYNIGWLGG